MENFSKLGLSEEVLNAIKDMGFTSPSKIQEEAIPLVIQGKDIIGQAQTGTGKTLAFGGGILSLIHNNNSKNPQAIIISPTRELAMQIFEEFGRIGKYNNAKVTCVYGGSDIERQIKTIKKGIDIVIGTPGRIMDLMRRKVLKLNEVRYVVLDEADEMLNMGFVEDIETILQTVPEDHQTVLFSATMPAEIKKIAQNYMKADYDHVKIESKTRTASTVKQYYYEVSPKDRFEALCRCIDLDGVKSGIIFCRTKRSVDEVCEKMQKANYKVEAMHGDLTQNHRSNTLRKFKDKTINFLIATDVAARGIDVDDVTHVINYELPQEIESYVHRIGRTGRANREGKAVTIVVSKEKGFLRQIERSTNSKIEKLEVPTLTQINENKVLSLISDVEDAIFAGKHKKFKSQINEIDPNIRDDFAAALLYMLNESNPGYNYTRETIEQVGNNNSGDMTRIFMTCGTMDKINPGAIVGFLCNEGRIRKSDIGSIEINRKNTYVDVNSFVVQKLIKNCSKKKIRNRRVNIEISNNQD